MPEQKPLNPSMHFVEIAGTKILTEIHKRNRFSIINGLTEITTIHQTQINNEDKVKINKKCNFSPQTGRFTFSETIRHYHGGTQESIITKKIFSTHDQDHKIINIVRSSKKQIINKQIQPSSSPR